MKAASDRRQFLRRTPSVPALARTRCRGRRHGARRGGGILRYSATGKVCESCWSTPAPDYVFQCAAATSPNATAQEMYGVHVTGTLNVLRAAAEFVPNAVLVFLGSAAEYGAVEDLYLPINEEHPKKPASLFGASKAAQTQLAFAAAVEWSLRVLVARPFNLLGPGLPEHYLAAALAKRLRNEGAATQPLPVANADATRDFVDVRDVADALVALAEKAAPAAGKAVRLQHRLGRGDDRARNRPRPVRTARQPVSGGPLGSASSRSRIRRSCGDASRLRRATGWQPRIAWRQSLRDLWDGLQQNGSTALAS